MHELRVVLKLLVVFGKIDNILPDLVLPVHLPPQLLVFHISQIIDYFDVLGKVTPIIFHLSLGIPLVTHLVLSEFLQLIHVFLVLAQEERLHHVDSALLTAELPHVVVDELGLFDVAGAPSWVEFFSELLVGTFLDLGALDGEHLIDVLGFVGL